MVAAVENVLQLINDYLPKWKKHIMKRDLIKGVLSSYAKL